MIANFIQVKDDAGYYDPNIQNSRSGQYGKLVYGWSLQEVFVSVDNISHFQSDEKASAKRDSIISQLELNKNASFTKIYFKQGASPFITVVGDTTQVLERLNGGKNGRPRK
jgi:hypothetical protein